MNRNRISQSWFSANTAGCCALLLVALSGCGRRAALEQFVRPGEVRDFDQLFAQNCSGCHGAEGQFGPAPPLNDPVFQEIISDAEITRIISEGRASTLMPAFARAQGGSLTDEQISILVRGIREKWKKPDLAGAGPLPAYVTPADSGDVHSLANREAALQVFGQVCGNCHGLHGQGGKQAGALRDSAFLSLVSDQLLRRIMITGRADLGMPDFRRLGAMQPSGQPLTSQQIADVVALMASWRHAEHHPEPAAPAGGL
jgi:cytochrome c oxidase cbb3-type subunit 3